MTPQQLAEELVLTDALTPNDTETLRPDYYIIDAKNLEYLAKTVLDLLCVSEEFATAHRSPNDDELTVISNTKFSSAEVAKSRVTVYNREVGKDIYVPVHRLVTDWRRVDD